MVGNRIAVSTLLGFTAYERASETILNVILQLLTHNN